ncbi:MAG: SpoIIE family protein phosphatase [Candidatus Aminicenantes bacterium]|nr:SpoIIE family protein phosphatase [Candidatus Aminicenantes bacterium]
MAKLYVYPKRGESFTIPFEREKITFGRSADNTLPLTDPFCSGHHAVLTMDQGRIRVRDLGSKNGVFVNGKRIQGEVEIRSGDEILIGQTRMSVDRKLLFNVEVSDGPSPSTSFNTVMKLNDILVKPESRTTTRAAPLGDLEKIRSEHRLFAVMSEVSKALLLHRPLNELLEHIMELISQNLPMDRGALFLREGSPEQLFPKVVRINDKSLAGQKMQLSRSIVDMAFEQELAVLSRDALSDPRFRARDSIITAHIKSAVCVPLWDNEKVIGIVYADRTSLTEPFDEEDLKLLTLLANLAAVKIENARLVERALENERMERELALAAQIQRDLLPRGSPSLEGYEICGLNLPCFEVGGDYYDFLTIDEDRLGVIIGDVSGKGVGAALLMASLRASLQSEISAGYDLAVMTSRLNNFVHRSSASNCFITFVFCEIILKTGAVRYVNAGHNPPAVLRPKGVIERLGPTGLCLGMFPASTYEIGASRLEKGDVILLFTDGLIESRNKAGQEMGEQKILDFLKRNVKRPAPELVKDLEAQFQDFTAGVKPFDDTTLVLIKKTS